MPDTPAITIKSNDELSMASLVELSSLFFLIRMMQGGVL